MKVFGIGLSRTGTSSLACALADLGLHALHYPWSREQIDTVDAATDTPVAAWFRELDAAYPGAKFILTQRNLPDWLDSCETFWQKASGNFDGFPSSIHRQLYGREDFDRLAFAMAYSRHQSEVLNHFSGRERDLLLMDVCDGDGWEQLCPFLGLDIPSTAFPRRNTRAAIGHDWVNDCPPKNDARAHRHS
jgi:Sulfotransferase domain